MGVGGISEMANLTNEDGKFAIAILRHFVLSVVLGIRHFRHSGNKYSKSFKIINNHSKSFYRISFDASSDPKKFKDDWPS